MVFEVLQEPDKALSDFEKACDIAPDFADAFYSRAVILASLDRFEEALMDFDKTTELDSEHAEAYLGKAECLTHLGFGAQAIEAVTDAICLDLSAEPYLLRAALHWRFGDQAASFRDFSAYVSRLNAEYGKDSEQAA